MLVRLSRLMEAAQAERIAASLAEDGSAPAGQPGLTSETARRLGADLRTGVLRNAAFSVAAMPRNVTEFQIHRMPSGMSYEIPIDRPVIDGGGAGPVRADLWITLFLNAPEDYDGGELTVNLETGSQKLKMAAGDAVIYPATNYHVVEPVTRGERWTAEAAIQSVVRDEEQRTVLTELWTVLDWMEKAPQENAEKLKASRQALKRARANLYRLWAEV